MAGKTATEERTGKRGPPRVTGGPGTAAMTVSLLSAIFTYARDHEWVEANPCLGIEKPASRSRDRYLKPGEYKALRQALVDAEMDGTPETVTDAVRVIALTGCRVSEVLSLTWDAVDADARCLRLADTKTGKQIRPCGAAALAVIEARREKAAGDYVFPSRTKPGAPLATLKKPFNQIRDRAGLGPDVTLHILRHSFATVAAEMDYSELTIAGLLGHAARGVTQRYAHRVDRALADAADQVSAEIERRMEEGAGG